MKNLIFPVRAFARPAMFATFAKMLVVCWRS